jgi:hypothetical protein
VCDFSIRVILFIYGRIHQVVVVNVVGNLFSSLKVSVQPGFLELRITLCGYGIFGDFEN